MPVSSDEVGALAYAPREHARAVRNRVANRSANLVAVFFVTAFLVSVVAYSVLRVLPSGPAQTFVGEVFVVGFAKRGALVATARLANGHIAQLRVPYSAKLVVGSFVTVREQPVRLGPPKYYFVGVTRPKL
jgi:hypothetical protein